MNDADRGIGHGLSHGLFYGAVLLPVTVFGLCPTLVILLANHARVAIQELLIEGWAHREKMADFYYDLVFRPLQTDVMVLGFGFLPQKYWWAVALAAFVLGFKSKNDWPLLLSWRR